MQTLPSAGRRRIYGMLGVLVLLLVVALGFGAYQQVFTPVVTITLQTDRAGLLTNPGAKVRLRGVKVGEVRSVQPAGPKGAKLELALQPNVVDSIPSDATARIAASTVFGPKSIVLSPAAGPVDDPVESGDVLRTRRVSTEVNTVFENLQEVLTTVQPGKLNATLGAIAETLDGRGEQLGAYLSQVNGYLHAFNPHLNKLTTAIASSDDVLKTYADVAPELLKIVKNSSVTSRTLTEMQAGLHAVLLDFTRTASSGKRFLDRTEEPLLTALDALRPTLSLLAEYSPQFTCMVNGITKARKEMNKVIGNVFPGIHAVVGLKPSEQPYTYPEDLPELVTGLGPDCYHLPIAPGEIAPKYLFTDGAEFEGDDNSLTVGEPVKLYTRLFGPYAEEVVKNLRDAGVLPR